MTFVLIISKAGERGGQGGAKYLGPGLVWGPRNFDKTSGAGCIKLLITF